MLPGACVFGAADAKYRALASPASPLHRGPSHSAHQSPQARLSSCAGRNRSAPHPTPAMKCYFCSGAPQFAVFFVRRSGKRHTADGSRWFAPPPNCQCHPPFPGPLSPRCYRWMQAICLETRRVNCKLKCCEALIRQLHAWQFLLAGAHHRLQRRSPAPSAAPTATPGPRPMTPTASGDTWETSETAFVTRAPSKRGASSTARQSAFLAARKKALQLHPKIKSNWILRRLRTIARAQPV